MFGYDALDRLTSSTVSGTSRTYSYNGDGLLQSRTQGGSTTNLLWDPAAAPSRLLQVGSDKIVYGLGPLYIVSGSATTTFARDGGKSVRAELSGSGAVNASFRYKAYGAIAQSNGALAPTHFGYAGQLLDPSGLYYMRARWYDPVNATFVSRDQARTDFSDPMSFAPFGYAAANPTNSDDPTGYCSRGPTNSARYCVAAYIPQAVVCGLGCYRGDNRGDDAWQGTSRIQFSIDDNGEIMDAHSDETIDATNSANRAQATPACFGGGGAYRCIGANPIEKGRLPGFLQFLVPSIDFTVTFDANGVHISGTSFPSYEVWGYDDEGNAYPLFSYDSNVNPFGPLGLFIPIDVPNTGRYY